MNRRDNRMEETEATLTVYFDDPFWVGVLTRREGCRLAAARIVFGAEPRDDEVYALLLRDYFTLRLGGDVDAPRRLIARMNPKRMQRKVSRMVESRGAGTKAQQALKQAHEAVKTERRTVSRRERDAQERRKYELRQQKRMEKHKGH
jgi:hypothetical protein